MSLSRVSTLPSARLALGRVAFACSLLCTAVAARADAVDLASLPIEQLMALEVFSASKFVQKTVDAPSAVSVVTAADIRAFGWRTLADILRSVRGLHVSDDRNYSYLGARGFLRPGDYNSRFLLLVDGNRINDALYDQGMIGSEFLLDVDLIERVEYVPGPGSSIYGANAFFGVINVITRRGRELDGGRLALAAGSGGAAKGRASIGWRDVGGAEVLLSASRFDVRGRDLYFREFDAPPASDGIAHGRDYDRGTSVFAKVSWSAFTATLARSERTKGVPTASYGQAFDDPRSRTVDAETMADLAWTGRLDAERQWSGHAFFGRNDYAGDYVYDRNSPVINRDFGHARWYGGELKWTGMHLEGQKLVAGVELQHDARRHQANFDSDGTTTVMHLDDHRQGNRSGIYAQDEIALRGDLLFDVGLRHDWTASTGGLWNPRLALIWKPAHETSVKALYGTAFRAPNAYEAYYAVEGEGGQKANPDLRAERIRSWEAVFEHRLSQQCRITASLFRNTVTDLITQTLDPADGLLVYRNLSRVVAHGAEVEYERIWTGGARLRTSLSLQRATDEPSGAELANAPRRLFKANLSLPVGDRGAVAGIETQHVGSRLTLRAAVPAYTVVNASVWMPGVVRDLDLTAGVYNLFDRRFSDPGGEEHVQDAIEQNGRSFRVKLVWHF